MLKKILLASAVSGAFLLTACGGSSGGSDPATPEPTPPPTTQNGDGVIQVKDVAGPLDNVQNQLSTAVFGQLGSAVAGTPLEGVIQCADAVVTYSTLDIADSVLAQLQTSLVTGGGTTMRPDPAVLADSLGSLAVNLTQLLQGLGDAGGGCLANSLTLDDINFTTNPLAGTPLEPLGTQLGPVLTRIATVLDAYDGREDDLQLVQISTLVSQLNAAMQTALQQIPADAYEAPVVGGVLSTVSTALNDTNALLGAVFVYNAQGTRTGLETLLNNTLVNTLTNVLPVHMIEQQAGQPGVISGPIEAGVAALASNVALAIGTVSTPALEDLLDGVLAPVLDPIENDLLPTILDPLTALIGGGLGGQTPDLGNPLAGTPLAPVIDAISSVVGGLLSGIGGGGGEGEPAPECPFANLPLLSALCGLT